MVKFFNVLLVILTFSLLYKSIVGRGFQIKPRKNFKDGITGEAFHNILNGDMCKVECDNRKFTLCNDYAKRDPGCKYKTLKIYSDKEMNDLNMKVLLIVGHNGLRDRIATRMAIANMIYIKWDDKLQKMSRHWANLCRPYEDDKCTCLGDTLSLNEAFTHYTYKLNQEKYVAMNRICIEATFIPNGFIEIALNIWYMGKNKLNAPLYSSSQYLKYGTVMGNNNFTHLAYPLTYRFGCTIAKYEYHFCLFCYYYPYYRNHNNSMAFLHEKPASRCPNEYPMEDTDFPAMCSTNLFNTDGCYVAQPALNYILLFMFYALLTYMF